MKYRVAWTYDGFYSRARQLRQVFDRRFANPLMAHAERFQWDYWHVPGEYTVLRTPAYHYFPKSVYEAFHRYLVDFGRRVLGCHDISPPWLSCYVEGCRQEPHQDQPHGPLAFVFSLTPRRRFRGGETIIYKPRQLIEPKFNRLTLFNPSLLHGVREVRGTHDPRHGRLVVHGWFVNPRPFWVGPLSVEDVREAIEEQFLSRIEIPHQHRGLLSLRLRISPAGHVLNHECLINTLAPSAQVRPWLKQLKQLKFAKRKAGSVLTLPLIVE